MGLKGHRPSTSLFLRGPEEAGGEQARESFQKVNFGAESRRVSSNSQVNRTPFSDNGNLGNLDQSPSWALKY